MTDRRITRSAVFEVVVILGCLVIVLTAGYLWGRDAEKKAQIKASSEEKIPYSVFIALTKMSDIIASQEHIIQTQMSTLQTGYDTMQMYQQILGECDRQRIHTVFPSDPPQRVWGMRGGATTPQLEMFEYKE
jgi:hypothetical protein